MKKINEIFYSLQGEGANTGIPAVFVRFSGCNLRCSFCDTRHQSGTMMTDEEIVAEVKRYEQARIVVLTGGEPSLYVDEEFLGKLKQATGKTITIETNGTHHLPEGIDWVTLSPKTGFEGGDLQPVILTECDELKVVYRGQPLEGYFGIKAKEYYLQPCYCDDAEERSANMRATIEAVMRDSRWRLSLQTHRIAGIR
ncbi:MAG: 7-carboxy-7-deazaguanine synthase QueE [Muribaculaceae bacterium]